MNPIQRFVPMHSANFHRTIRSVLQVWLWLAACAVGLAQNLPQTILLSPPRNGVYLLGERTRLRSTATSGLPVEYALLRGPGELVGDALLVTNVGTLLVEARVGGNAQYRPTTNRFRLNRDRVVLSRLGSLAIGPTNELWDVRLVGDFAYVAAGSEGLKVVDVGDPANPRRVGEMIPPRPARRIDVAGNYAYVVAGFDLDVVDVEDPTRPVRVSSTRLPGTFNQMVIRVVGSLAYIASGPAGLLIVDVADPASPRLLGSWNSPGLALGVDVVDGFAYLADQNSGLRILDVRDPARPIPVAVQSTPGPASDVRVVAGFAYVACGAAGLLPVDVRDPFRPRSGSREASASVSQIRPVGDLLFVGYIVDASDPLELEVRGDSVAGRVDVRETILARLNAPVGQLEMYQWRRGFGQPAPFFPIEQVFTNAPLELPGIEPMSRLPITYTLLSGPARLESGRLRLTGEGRVVLKGENSGSIQFHPLLFTNSFVVKPNQVLTWVAPTTPILPIGTPQRLVATASSGLPVQFRVLSGPARVDGDQLTFTNVSLAGSVHVVAEQLGSDTFTPVSEVRVFNATAFPEHRIATHAAWRPLDLKVSGTRAYLVDEERLRVLDLTQPEQPIEIGSAPLPFAPYLRVLDPLRLTVAGNLAFVCAGHRGLFLFDITDPARPVLAGRYDQGFAESGPKALRVAVAGHRAFLAAGPAGLLILDVTAPALPVLIASWKGELPANSIQLRGNTALINAWDTDGNRRFSLIDVSRPEVPTALGSVAGSGFGDFAVRDDGIVVVVTGSVMTVIDASNPTRPSVVGHLWRPTLGLPVATAVEVRGNFAFIVGADQGLGVIDISVPSRPVRLRQGVTASRVSNTLQLSGDLAFWATADGLVVENLSPRHPQRIDWDTLSKALPLDRPIPLRAGSSSGSPVDFRVVSGPARIQDGALIVTNHASVIVEAVPNGHPDFDPTPVRRTFNRRTVWLEKPGPFILREREIGGMAAVGDLAYITSRQEGVHVVGLQDPANLALLGLVPLPGAHRIHVAGTLAFVAVRAGASPASTSGLTLLDLADPARPRVLSHFATDADPTAVFASGSRVYLTFGSMKLVVIDVGNPSMPVLLREIGLTSRADGITVRPPHVFLTDSFGAGLQVLDLGVAGEPQVLQNLAGSYIPSSRIRGNALFAANDTTLQAWDISLPGRLNPLSQLDDLFSARALAVGDDLLFLNSNGLIEIVEAGDPRFLAKVGQAAASGWSAFGQLATVGNLLIAEHWKDGVAAYVPRFSLTPTLDSISFPAEVSIHQVLELPTKTPEGFPLQYTVFGGIGVIEGGRLRFNRIGPAVLRWETPADGFLKAAVMESLIQVKLPDGPPPRIALIRDGNTLRLLMDPVDAVIENAATIDGEWTPRQGPDTHVLEPGAEQLFFRARLRSP